MYSLCVSKYRCKTLKLEMLNRTESKAKAVDIARCLKTRCFAGNNFNEIEDLFGQLLLFVFFVISPYLTASRIAFKLMSVRKKNTSHGKPYTF